MLGSGLSGPHTICRRTMKILIYHPGCMYKGCEWMKRGIDQMPPWWHCMMDINLLVLFTIEELTNPDQIPTPYAENQTQTCNHHPRCFNLAWQHPLHRWTYCLCESNFKLVLIGREHQLLFISAVQFLCFCEQINVLTFHSMMGELPFVCKSPTKGFSDWTSLGCQWACKGLTGYAALTLPAAKGCQLNVFFAVCVYLHFLFLSIAHFFHAISTWVLHVEKCIS